MSTRNYGSDVVWRWPVLLFVALSVIVVSAVLRVDGHEVRADVVTATPFSTATGVVPTAPTGSLFLPTPEDGFWDYTVTPPVMVATPIPLSTATATP